MLSTTSTLPKVRVGAVNYLNTKPLIYGLTERASQIELILDLPSRLADRLEKKDLDVALIPSVEFFQDPDYTVVSDACIACDGPVHSVKLFFRTAPDAIETLALDEGSRTSGAMAHVMLQDRFGVHPEIARFPVDASLESSTADAVLLIGDRAMHTPADGFKEVWDLGEQWRLWTDGMPFVFAMWVARPGVDLQGIETALSAARDDGLMHLNEISRREAPILGLTEAECLSYLRDNLRFKLGPREWKSLEFFYRQARMFGIAPAGVDFGRYHHDSA